MNLMIKQLTLIFSLLLIFPVFADEITTFKDGKTYAHGSVVIAAPPEAVWKYLSDDSNARNWSIFFYSITECPKSECPANNIKSPGDIGYIRRSNRNHDKSGLRWDEETLKVVKTKKYLYKAIRAYDFIGYGDIGNKSEHLVEQIFERVDNNFTKLTFRSSLYEKKDLTVNNDDNPDNDMSFLEYKYAEFTFEKLSKERASEMFQKNLENIKAAVELGDKYQRVHPYQKFCDVKKWYCFEFLQDY